MKTKRHRRRFKSVDIGATASPPFNQGRVEQLGPPLTLYHEPANEFVAGFLGAPRINLINRPQPGASAAHGALWQALAGNAPATVQRTGLRPEHWQVSRDASAATGTNGAAAEVVLAEHLGDAAVLHLRVAGLADLISAKIGPGHTDCQAGQTVMLQADVGAVLWFDGAGKRVMRGG